jgi:DNA-binding transcriptional LysR family regulator
LFSTRCACRNASAYIGAVNEAAVPTALLRRLARRAHLLGDFLAVARAGGIRQSAEEVHVSQSALTRRIQDLEQALGVALFERSALGMRLTTFGEALRHHAELVEMNCTYAATEVSQLLSGAAGELRVAAGPAFVYELAPDAVIATRARLPGVRISLLARLNDATLPLLQAGRLDVVLGGLPEAASRSGEIRYEPLLHVEHCVFADRRHPLHAQGLVAPADLAAFPWVWFSEAVTARRQLEALFQGAGLQTPAASVETTSVHFGVRVLGDASHLMLMPSTLVRVAARHGLGALPVQPSVGRYVAGLMYRPSVLRLHAFVEFRAALRAALGEEAIAP